MSNNVIIMPVLESTECGTRSYESASSLSSEFCTETCLVYRIRGLPHFRNFDGVVSLEINSLEINSHEINSPEINSNFFPDSLMHPIWDSNHKLSSIICCQMVSFSRPMVYELKRAQRWKCRCWKLEHSRPQDYDRWGKRRDDQNLFAWFNSGTVTT